VHLHIEGAVNLSVAQHLDQHFRRFDDPGFGQRLRRDLAPGLKAFNRPGSRARIHHRFVTAQERHRRTSGSFRLKYGFPPPERAFWPSSATGGLTYRRKCHGGVLTACVHRQRAAGCGAEGLCASSSRCLFLVTRWRTWRYRKAVCRGTHLAKRQAGATVSF
jgi:hypothetical protein